MGERAEVRPQADLEANKVPPQEEPEALEDLPLDEVEVDQGEMQHIDPPVDQHNDDSTSRSNNSNNSYDPLYDDIPKIVNQWRRDVRGVTVTLKTSNYNVYLKTMTLVNTP